MNMGIMVAMGDGDDDDDIGCDGGDNDDGVGYDDSEDDVFFCNDYGDVGDVDDGDDEYGDDDGRQRPAVQGHPLRQSNAPGT